MPALLPLWRLPVEEIAPTLSVVETLGTISAEWLPLLVRLVITGVFEQSMSLSLGFCQVNLTHMLH